MKKNLCLWTIGVAALLLGQNNAMAQTAAPATLMDEVVITATRVAEEVASIPANVTVISEQEIAQSPASTVAELLRGKPGVLVNDITGNGRNYTIDLRGFGETAALNTLVLIDGRRINQADLSGVDWSLIPKQRVARIEIIRGGRGGVLYGDNAAGGVINIITRKGQQDLQLAGALSLGSYGSQQASASISGETSLLSYAFSINRQAADGYRDNSETTAKDFGLDLDLFISDRFILNITSGYHDDKANLPGALSKSALASGLKRTATLHPDDFADTEDWYLQAGPQLYFTDSSYLKVDTSIRKRRAKFYSFFDAGSYQGKTDIETLRIAPQLAVNEELAGKAVQLVAGFDFEKSSEDILNDSVFYGYASVNNYQLTKKNSGYFAHAELGLSEKLAISGGYRHDKVRFTFSPVSPGTKDSNKIDEELYTAGASYRVNNQLSLYGSYAKSFRYPVLDEMFNFYANTVDSSLKAQTADDFEAGLHYQGEGGLALGLNLFRIDTAREIFYNPASFANENLDGDILRQGIELTAAKTVADILLQASYTYTDTEIEGGQYDGKALPNVPVHQFSLAAQRKLGEDFLLDLSGVYIGERPFISDFSNAKADQEAYLYVTGKLSYLMEKGTAYLAVKNLLNQEYAEYGALNYLGEEGFYPSAKINFVAGVDFKF